MFGRLFWLNGLEFYKNMFLQVWGVLRAVLPYYFLLLLVLAAVDSIVAHFSPKYRAKIKEQKFREWIEY